MQQRAARVGLCSGVFAAIVLGFAPGRAEEAPTPLSSLNGELQGIQNLVQNARMKLKHGISGGTAQVGNQAESTPGRQCCSANIAKLRDGAQRSTELIEALTVRYERQSNRAGVDLLAQIRENLIVVSQGVTALERSPSVARAEQALAGMILPINRIRDAAQGLAACCPEPLDPDPSAAAAKPPKKKKGGQ